MLKRYLTTNDYGEKSITIRKSEFIGYVKHATSEEEANAFIESIKKKHWDATHNCSAYVIGEHDQFQKANDDGEPSGTAGKPILEVIKKMGLKDTVVVVTRYFGGILLGAGGLIRAYGKAAKEGILAAGVIERILYRQVHVTIDYTWYGKIENEMKNRGITVHDVQFLENVMMTLLAVDGEEDQLVNMVTNLTNGQADLTIGEALYVDKAYHPYGDDEDEEEEIE
ncbi:YigZ family protein [Tepidibacillus sp. HK-1]|uniref:YigZ family protein n=1 Tax=Tepidibacillus sp. HK-1 TaxID=1883407 RepID=UPI000853ACF2|nr:YigZ family protein [Tepidibacillus sp. HK-1]GBF12288.1 IMPACT family member YigZ [Tepidibacillus sp. HK-1]